MLKCLILFEILFNINCSGFFEQKCFFVYDKSWTEYKDELITQYTLNKPTVIVEK